jgi:hypothetical protein
MIRNLAAIALASVALLGCESTSEPPRATDVYSLQPPAVLDIYEGHLEILNETLFLFADGTARREFRQRYDFNSPTQRDTTVRQEQEYTYELRGNRIELTFECPPNALCIAPPHLWGELTADGLELRWHVDTDVPLRYRRVGPLDE